MTNHKPSSNGKRRARPNDQATSRGKRIRIEPKRRRRVDPDMIALCYWLLAQRIVQEAADDSEATAQADGTTDDDSDTATATATDNRPTRSTS